MSVIPTRSRGELRNIYRFGAFALALVVGITALLARMFFPCRSFPGGKRLPREPPTIQATKVEPIDPSARFDLRRGRDAPRDERGRLFGDRDAERPSA